MHPSGVCTSGAGNRATRSGSSMPPWRPGHQHRCIAAACTVAFVDAVASATGVADSCDSAFGFTILFSDMIKSPMVLYGGAKIAF